MEATMEAVHHSLRPGSRQTMDTLLTIAEAAEKVARSHSTIRRLIKTIADSPAHPDRSGIEPSRKVVEAFKKKGENFTWMVREDVLRRHLQSAPNTEEKQDASSSGQMKQDVFQILRKELEIKNRQIEKQWDVINSLNERLREGNILMGSLQQRLALPTGESPSPIVVETPPPERGSVRAGSMEASTILRRASKKKVMEVKQAISRKASVQSVAKPSRRGFFAWVRGK